MARPGATKKLIQFAIACIAALSLPLHQPLPKLAKADRPGGSQRHTFHTRVNVDSMLLDDLLAHVRQVLDTIGAMNGYLNCPAPKSSVARLNGLRLANKLRSHMARVRDLINAHTAAAALAKAA